MAFLEVEAVEIWFAADAILEGSVSEAAGQVEFPVDAILVALLEDDAPSRDHVFEFGGVRQIVAGGVIFDVAAMVYAQQLAVAQAGNKKLVFHGHCHQRSAPFLELFYNLSLHLLEH